MSALPTSIDSPASALKTQPARPLNLPAHLASLAFLFGAIALGVFVCHQQGYNPNRILTHFLVPFYVLATALQYVFPEQPNHFEPGEVWTDTLNNVGLVVISSLQTLMVHWLASFGSPGLLFHFGLIDPQYSMSRLPFWAQVAIEVLLFDFLFYVTHRIAHEVDLFWRLHSVHHSAHRISVLNASRAHPLDLAWRRLLPIFIVLQTGISPAAFVTAGVIGSVLATITHMNVDFRFGWLNQLIGTNEVHRWHHSTELDEAKNFSMILIWDHLLGTFVLPAGRSRPEHLGLNDERGYPLHRYLGQLLVPWRWGQPHQQGGQATPPAAPGA